MAEPPPLPEGVWEQILLRLPPDDPASLLRASLVCKLWRRIFSSPGFLRRLSQLHRAPPMLGFFRNLFGKSGSGFDFVPTTASSFALPISMPFSERERRACRVLDCRHGRVLLIRHDRPRGLMLHRSQCQKLLVWEPFTGYRRILPDVPDVSEEFDFDCLTNAAVMCAAEDCDHCSCHGRPFRVVTIYTHDGHHTTFVTACVYSSETGAWGVTTSVEHGGLIDKGKASILVGNFLYFLCHACTYFTARILKYDPQGHILSEISVKCWNEDAHHMQAEDGRLGFATLCKQQRTHGDLKLFSWDEETWVKAPWEPTRTIPLQHRFPSARMVGFAEGANIILLTTADGIFTIELNSGRARKACHKDDVNTMLPLFPLVGFYSPCRRPGKQPDAKE